MGQTFDYQVHGFSEISLVKAVYERAGETLTGFKGFDPKEEQNAYLEPVGHLPKLEGIEGIAFTDIIVQGHLSLATDPFPAFAEALESAGSMIGQLSALIVSVGFEEKTSRQTKGGYDVVSAKVDGSRQHFLYDANGSRVSTDKAYRAKFIRRLIEIARLPLVMTEGGGHFHLSHGLSGDIRTCASGVNDQDPSGFWCEIPGASVSDLLDRMKAVLSECATKKRFDQSWSAVQNWAADIETKIRESRLLYDALQASNFPAERYFINSSFTMESIEGLEAIRALCGPKDEIYTNLGRFPLSGRNYATLQVVTTAAGHRLELEARLPVKIDEINRKLGVEFQPAK